MADIETLRSLLARVEAAEGPDREIDLAICRAFPELDYLGHAAGLPDEDFLQPFPPVFFQRFTASIEAVVTLVERVLPSGWTRIDVWNTDDVKQVTASVLPLPVPNTTSSGKAATPALALLSALLKALIAKEESHVEGE